MATLKECSKAIEKLTQQIGDTPLEKVIVGIGTGLLENKIDDFGVVIFVKEQPTDIIQHIDDVPVSFKICGKVVAQ